MAALSRIPHVTCQVPQGAFYVLPDISHYFHKRSPEGDVLHDSHEICLYLLKQYKASASATAFPLAPPSPHDHQLLTPPSFSSYPSLPLAVTSCTQVALVSGDAFGAPTTLRISYATSEAELDTAMERLTQCLASLT